MLNTSNEWEQAILNDNRRFLNRVQIISPNGSNDWQMTVNSDRIMQGGSQFSNGTTSIGSFDIGATVVGKYALLLQNYNDQFIDYLFEGATVIAYVGLELESGTEWIRKGTYTVSDAKFHNGIVTLDCYDNLNKFARNIPSGFMPTPTTLGELLRKICSYCGVVLATNSLEMQNYMISNIGEQTTFLDAICFIAQIEGAFARCNPLGQLEITWYDEIVDGAGLDGGTFDFIEGNTSYHDGDIADGGSFNPWNVGFEFDSGDFADMSKFWIIVYYTSNNIDIEDVVITGIQVEDTNGEEPFEVLVGSEGYVLSVSNNDFITKDTASIVANHLKAKIVGMRFRPLKLSILGNPAMEAGDNAYVVDRKGRAVYCILTNIDYTIGNKASVSCDAMSAVRNSADRNNVMTRAIVQARKNTGRMLSDYDLTMQQLTSLITQSFGLFKTEEVLEDGSTIFYMHNKPLLKDSMTIWKMTADAFAVSTNGGKTWNAGIDSSGNAVVNVLSAIGINFDWARGGTLTLGGYNGINGTLRVLDANSNEIGVWNNEGFVAEKGVFYGTLYTEQQSAWENSIGLRLEDGLIACHRDGEVESLIDFSANYENERWMSVNAGETLGLRFTTQGYLRLEISSTLNVYQHLNMNGFSVLGQSDERLKENIKDLSGNVTEKLSKITPISYNWKKDGKRVEAGLSAQNLQEVFPELVVKGEDGYLSINTIGLIPYLLKAHQEWNSKLTKTNDRLQKLEERMQKLEGSYGTTK